MKKNFQLLQSYTQKLSILMTVSGGLINKKKLIKAQNNRTNTIYLFIFYSIINNRSRLAESVVKDQALHDLQFFCVTTVDNDILIKSSLYTIRTTFFSRHSFLICHNIGFCRHTYIDKIQFYVFSLVKNTSDDSISGSNEFT